MGKSRTKEKILMILSKPFVIDPRVSQEAKSLVKDGHEVTVIVWDRHKEYKPEEIVDGVRIVRIHNNSLVDALHSDVFRNPFWWRKAYEKALELYKNNFKFDVVHCHDLDTLKSGVWIKKKLGVTLIYDAHEIFGYMIERFLPWIISVYALKLEKKLIKKVDFVITVNKPLKEYFQSITDKPIEIIMNCKKLINEKYISPKNEVFTVCYFGVFNSSRLFPNLVHALGKVDNIKFLVAGKKEGFYKAVKIRCSKYDNIEFLGSISIDEVIDYTKKSDAVICPFDPVNKNNQMGLPNKFFESMVCGRPIISSKGTYLGEFTEKLDCGVVEEFSEQGVIDGIIKLRDNPELCKKFGKNGLKAAIDQFNWDKQEEKLLRIYEHFI